MKREILICVCALTVIASTTDSIYACCEKPVADFSAPSDICIDCEVGFDASGSYDPDNTDLTYDWNFGSGAYDEDVSDPVHPTCKYSTAGVKTVILEVTDDDDPGCCGGDPNCHDKKSDPNAVETVTVVRVDKVVENVSPFTNEGPLDTCIDESISLLAFAYPPSGSFPADEPHWSIESQPADANATLTPSTGSSLTNLGNMTKAGNYVIKAQCGDSDDGDTITVIADGWEANPAISGAAIKKSHDQEWFHISQSCDLKAKGYDADTKCDTEYDDYIRLDLTEWTGPYLFPTTGETVTWSPDEPTTTSGVTISATIKDDPDLPDGSNTDDADDSASRVLKAYEAAADLVVNWANSGGSGNDTKTVFETGTTYDSISKNMDDSESVSVDASTLPDNTTGTDPSFFEPQEPFVKGKWTLKLHPSTAPLDAPGKIKVTTDVEASGTFECTVDDEDVDLSGGCDVSIGVEIPGPLSISISPDLDTSGDENEAQAAISWGYDSDLGPSRESPLSEELEKSSGDGDGTFQQTFNYSPFSQDHIGEKGEITEALAKVGGKIEAKGYNQLHFEPPETWVNIYWDASASMACTGSTVTYYIMDPTVQNPAYWPPESGYDD